MTSELIRSVVVGLGANLGDRLAQLEGAVAALHDEAGVQVLAVSRVYETAPLGPAGPPYLNAAARIETTLSLRELLELAHAIEATHGRERKERWGPRTLDIDILWAEGEALDRPDLVVPHPRLMERAFALAPLLDVLVAPEHVFVQKLEALGGAPPIHQETLSQPK